MTDSAAAAYLLPDIERRLAEHERMLAALERLEAGEEATSGRDFGRGVAHAARTLRTAQAG